MKWSLQLGKIAGIRVFVHWTFLLLILWIVIMHIRAGHDTIQIISGVAFILALFACVVLHELGHALTARRYRINTRSINLLPIGGVALLEGMPEKPAQELAVAIAGPLVNIVIAIVLYLLLYLTNSLPVTIEELDTTGNNFWASLLVVNIFLAFFNLIPAFPMDGGRIFRALLSFRFSRTRATQIAALLGQVLAVLFILAGLYMNPMLILIGLFVFMGAQAERKAEEVKSALSGIRVGDMVMQQYSTLSPTDPLSDAARLLLNSQEKAFLVTANNEITGTLSWKEIVSGLAAHDAATPVEKVMNRNFTRISSGEPVQQAMEKMKENPDALFPVYSEKGLVGVINFENISEFMTVRRAAGSYSGLTGWLTPGESRDDRV